MEGIGAARLGKFVARPAGSGRMTQIAPQIRSLVAVEAIDGRKGIDALAQLCREKLNADPFSGFLFIFRTRRGTAIRVLQYDGQGFWLATKCCGRDYMPGFLPMTSEFFPCSDAGVCRSSLDHRPAERKYFVVLPSGCPKASSLSHRVALAESIFPLASKRDPRDEADRALANLTAAAP
jgi:IS66 Orf2 like protein